MLGPNIRSAGSAGLVFVGPQLVVQAPGFQAPRMAGTYLIGIVAVLQTLVIGVVAPLVGAASIAGERERSTWLSLLASPVPRSAIASGKLIASCLYVLVLISVSLPIAALAVTLGALDLRTLVGLYLEHAILGLTLTSLGVAASTLFGRTWTAALAAIGAMFALTVFSAAAGASASAALAALELHDLYGIVTPIWWLNPSYGTALFFGGTSVGATGAWLGHWLSMGLLGALSAVFAWTRLATARA